MPKYDDVGSLPLPEKVNRGEFERGLLNFEDWALKICRESMELKIGRGVEVPCYPQLRDMINQFLEPLKDPKLTEEPYLIRKGEANLPELLALRESSTKLPQLKMCVTGPLELTSAEFESKIHGDILLNLARSLKRFIKNAESMRRVDVGVVSIDEPSLGMNPQLVFDDETLIQAWDIVGDTKMDVQVHLHSALFNETACKSSGVDIIDIGTAGRPENLGLIDPELIDSYEKGVRIGVSRTDALSMAAEFNERNNVNVWESGVDWQILLDQIDPPARIAERIEKAYERFGELVKYFGPDCGVGGVIPRDFAAKILENTKSGINLFRKQS
ncbi:hypothetical protein AKJ48_03805 [candidate division MSBL1 archaeon SCGC-AAA261O19]|uniref:Cobalamin-independent methionine synthase MetE C-terminal/archaeal domain-containing protein n=2 Tax=candidate division MSBL1 TaxID=215777 RepID=A0A133V1A4_9EURY|nr:hypothetical protein AKJ42_01540 [candidate division MSBL1 archaeon SCGC-AAA261C02]KXB03522.1 hypothetical protein AKJ48_03805 [candidate division MSBL1 archaeon SCGC-AAA261O19]